MEFVVPFAASAAFVVVVLPKILEPSTIEKQHRVINKIFKMEPIDSQNANKNSNSNGKTYTKDLLDREFMDGSVMTKSKSIDQARLAVIDQTISNQQRAMAWNTRVNETIPVLMKHKNENKPVLFGSLTGNLNVHAWKA